ncbi:MAG: hypothetical protein J4G13_14875 [Dehalococcoidia bacterium]|nr:hypothetical protein [Dehalococcoidia bacterium]
MEVVMVSASHAIFDHAIFDQWSDAHSAVSNGVKGDAVIPEKFHAEKGFGIELQDSNTATPAVPNDRHSASGDLDHLATGQTPSALSVHADSQSANIPLRQKQLTGKTGIQGEWDRMPMLSGVEKCNS